MGASVLLSGYLARDTVSWTGTWTLHVPCAGSTGLDGCRFFYRLMQARFEFVPISKSAALHPSCRILAACETAGIYCFQT
jgi:hypothetical protein